VARTKQTKEYRKARETAAKEAVVNEFGIKGLRLAKKRYVKEESRAKQSEVINFLVEKEFSYREIGRLIKKTPEAIRKSINRIKDRESADINSIDKEWKIPVRINNILTHEEGEVNYGLLDFVGEEEKEKVEVVPARSFKPLLVPLLLLLLLLTPFLISPALRSKVRNALTPTTVVKLVEKEEKEEKDTTTDTVADTDPLASYSPTSGSILMGDGSNWDSTSTTSITKVGTITSGTWNGDEIDISDYTNLTAGDSITLSDDTLNVDDDFLLNTGDTGSGSYTFKDNVTLGSSASDKLTIDSTIQGSSLTFEGSTGDANETTLTVTEPTADRTITFPNASGEVTLLGQDITTTTGTTSTTSSNSGLETTDEGVRMVGGCNDDQILKWDSTTNTWNCEADTGGGASQLTDLSDVNTSTPTNNNILMADGTDWESTPQTSIT